MNRFARQQILTGWDQDRLSSARVAIVGTGPMAYLSGMMAVAMGMGQLVLVGDGKAGNVSDRFASWRRVFGRINPETEIRCQPHKLGGIPGEGVDGMLVATNDLESHVVAQKLSQCADVTVVAGSAASRLGTWGSIHADKRTKALSRCRENPVLSQIIAALLVEELRKRLLPLPNEAGPCTRRNLIRMPAAGAISPHQSELISLASPWRGIALIGAGALGTWFGIGLGVSGLPVALHIYDDDAVEETNLNRQILFGGSVGAPKAVVLARRLQGLFPHLKTAGYAVRATEGIERELIRSPVMAASVDNFRARAYLSDLARRRGRLLINGGTSAAGGSCMVYEPMKSACLNCRIDVDKLADEEERPQSCGGVQEGSIVTTNALIGALMVWSLQMGTAGEVHRGIWEYDGSARDVRMGARSAMTPCVCYR